MEVVKRVFAAQLEVEMVQLFQLLLNTGFAGRPLKGTSVSQAATSSNYKDFRFVTLTFILSKSRDRGDLGV